MKNYRSYTSNTPYYPESLNIKDEKIISDMFREQNAEQPQAQTYETPSPNQTIGMESLLGLLGKGGGFNNDMLTSLLANNLLGGKGKGGNFMAEAMKMMINPKKKKEQNENKGNSTPTTFEEL
ncbi:MAG: hypothetical protein J6K39_00985 [Clostridia bacterium]|nr:hypothetical protein [Clostridia bacterium]